MTGPDKVNDNVINGRVKVCVGFQKLNRNVAFLYSTLLQVVFVSKRRMMVDVALMCEA